MINDNSENVEFATSQDIGEMVAICATQLVANREGDNAQNMGKSGFLIVELTKDQAKDIINDSKDSLALILKRDDEILGYLTAFDIKKTEDEFRQKVFSVPQLQKFGKKIFYYNQIAKKPNSKNVGKKLTLAMVDEAKKRGNSCIICKIGHKPFRNEASIAFHEKLGFKCIEEIDKGGYLCGIYWKEVL